MFFIAFFPLVYLYTKAGITEKSIEITMYTLPLTLLFSFFGGAIIRSVKRKIKLSDTGIIVEDFSKNEIPWTEIKSVKINSQILPKGGMAYWLTLGTENNNKYVNKTVQKLNTLLGIHGIPICNLSTYNVNNDLLLNKINNHINRNQP